MQRGIFILMHISTSIEPKWVEECAPEQWRNSVKFKVNEDGSFESCVQEKIIHGVGELIMQRLSCRAIEESTNTKILINHEKGVVSCAGLYYNVEDGLKQLKTSICH